MNRKTAEQSFLSRNGLAVISFSGLFLMVIMYIWAPESEIFYDFQKPIILSIFIAICLLGILAAIYPKLCKGLLEFKKIDKKSLDPEKMYIIQFKGHHPDCGKFESHTIIIQGRKYCPGCSGLLIGAILGVIGILFYYFYGLPLIYGEISFWTGLVMVFLALMLIISLKLGKKLKIVSNLVLVTGSAMILVGLDTVKENLLIEFYFLLLVLFFILARVAASENNHEIICRNCEEKSFCIYE